MLKTVYNKPMFDKLKFTLKSVYNVLLTCQGAY
uniref:Uncharacterized protein n=1 Tax=Anguilla anguilla TaxID=7936 RepID=A0A0E9UG58_ANGAN